MAVANEGRMDYRDTDLMRMQQEAAQRVRDMQRRARDQAAETDDSFFPSFVRRSWRADPATLPAGEPNGAPPIPPLAPPVEPPPPAADTAAAERGAAPVGSPPDSGPISTLLQDIVKAIGLDDDRLLLIGLLLILINEKADDTLILALCYLLL